KIANRQSRLETLEIEAHKEDRQLLEDIYCYDSYLRLEDFSEAQKEEGKTDFQIQIEQDFHTRYISLKNKKEEIEQIRQQLSHLNTDPGEKILDHNAPLIIADILIQQHFLYEG